MGVHGWRKIIGRLGQKELRRGSMNMSKKPGNVETVYGDDRDDTKTRRCLKD